MKSFDEWWAEPHRQDTAAATIPIVAAQNAWDHQQEIIEEHVEEIDKLRAQIVELEDAAGFVMSGWGR